MSYNSNTAQTKTIVFDHQNFGSLHVDTSNAVFHATTPNLGGVVLGEFKATAQLYTDDAWISLSDMDSDPAIKNGGQVADDFLSEFFADPKVKDRTSEVIKQIGLNLEPGCGLAGLRMRAGFSQKEFAALLNMQQPAISRWEKNPGQISTDNVLQICDTLGIDTDEYFRAIRPQQSHHSKTKSVAA